MPATFAALTLISLVLLVIARLLIMRRAGVQPMHFGKQDKKDFLIPPVALFYFYTVFANAFGWPLLSTQRFFDAAALGWLGVAFCAAGLLLVLWSLVSFGRSFRVGIDEERPGALITSGAFAHSRNPIYTGFWIILLGQFLIFPNWVLLLYLGMAAWLLHRQVRREEVFMAAQYGAAYAAYRTRVRRYL